MLVTLLHGFKQKHTWLVVVSNHGQESAERDLLIFGRLFPVEKADLNAVIW